MKTIVGGIKFIPEQKRVELDNELISIAKNLLSITKPIASEMMDYDYNCLIGAVRYRLNKVSNEVENMRLKDIEAKERYESV